MKNKIIIKKQVKIHKEKNRIENLLAKSKKQKTLYQEKEKSKLKKGD